MTLPAKRVLPVAIQIWRALMPACVKVKIAGSLRRECGEVGDIDIVAWPRLDRDLFGEECASYSGLDAALAELKRVGTLATDTDVIRDGLRYKRFQAPALDGMPVEIWITDRDNWGYILALRTGPETLNRLLVTPVRQSGLCPPEIALIGGHVWWYPASRLAEDARRAKRVGAGRLLSCPTEEDFWSHMRLPSLPPAQREVSHFPELIRLAAAGGGRRQTVGAMRVK